MVVGNLVGGSELGFESDENEVVLTCAPARRSRCPAPPSAHIADRIFDEVLHLRLALHAADGR